MYENFNIDPDGFKMINYVIKKQIKTPSDFNGSDNVFFNRDDLFGEGMVGLVKALNTYDDTKKVKFESYAINVIRNEMLMYIRNKVTINNKHFSFSMDEKIKDKNNDDCKNEYAIIMGNSDKYFKYDEDFFEGLYKLIQKTYKKK